MKFSLLKLGEPSNHDILNLYEDRLITQFFFQGVSQSELLGAYHVWQAHLQSKPSPHW